MTDRKFAVGQTVRVHNPDASFHFLIDGSVGTIVQDEYESTSGNYRVEGVSCHENNYGNTTRQYVPEKNLSPLVTEPDTESCFDE